jgi:hypothetical protein
MTWGEFKAAVEAAGVEDDDEVRYIDCNPRMAGAITVERRAEEEGRFSFRIE